MDPAGAEAMAGAEELAGAEEMAGVEVMAEGLAFPEGPVALHDGTVLLVEMQRGTLTRVTPGGRREVVAETGGGPNGAAIGPDGAAYVCNNGGLRAREPGRIERVDLSTGQVERVVEAGGGERLRAPNDIVFDAAGGFWFTDHGRRSGRQMTPGGIYYVPPGADEATEAVFPVAEPNGIGLSPDGATLYWSETNTRRVVRRRLDGPGRLAPSVGGGVMAILRGDVLDDSLLAGMGGNQLLDSLAVDAGGHVAVGTLLDSGITVISPGGAVQLIRLPAAAADLLPTNICFGGEGMRTAYVTLSQTGRLIRATWPRPGLPLAFGA